MVIHIEAGERDVVYIVRGQSGMAAGAASQETVEDVNQPEGAAERLILKKLVWVGLVGVSVDDAIHLSHTGGLTKVNIGADSIAAAPFVNHEQTESLNIGKTGLVQGLHDKVDGLGGKVLCGGRATSMAAIAPNHGWRMSVWKRISKGLGICGMSKEPNCIWDVTKACNRDAELFV